MPRATELVKKVCLMGDPGVGKTSLIRRFVLDQFSDEYLSTIGAKVTKKVKPVQLPEQGVQVQMVMMIWDVAGQKEYHQFHEIYLQGMEGVLSVCDLSRRETIEGMRGSLTLINKHAPVAPVVFLLNKCDLVDPSRVNLREVQAAAQQRGIPIIPTSAKTGLNVEAAFDTLGKMIARQWVKERAARPC